MNKFYFYINQHQQPLNFHISDIDFLCYQKIHHVFFISSSPSIVQSIQQQQPTAPSETSKFLLFYNIFTYKIL